VHILVVGSGGREHALAWKIRQSPKADTIYCAPGNGGTEKDMENVHIPAHDIPGLIRFAKEKSIGLTVVGPDDALAAGIVDAFQKEGLRIFGPTRAAARFEWSKIFAKEFMARHAIPSAASKAFDSSEEALAWIQDRHDPLVVKADGLALGKGVVIAHNKTAAEEAIRQSMDEGIFGDAGRKIVIEEFLQGPECSFHALIDGSHSLIFPDSKDHKQAYDHDQGPNTGGMGTISPSGVVTSHDEEGRRIIEKFIAGTKAENIDFRGMLFPGLMKTAHGLRVLEFNCRFGDPETQVLVRRLRSDLVELLEATIDGHLDQVQPAWDTRAAVCVILASGGYPGHYEKGLPIEGIDEAEADPDVVVFHAGTRRQGNQILTHGGRVLGVTALGDTLEEARTKAYAAADKISFPHVHRRNDIGSRSPT